MKKDSIRDKHVIVTGGAGVIGRELLNLLVQKGASVLSVDRHPLFGEDRPRLLHIQKDIAEGGLDELRSFQPQVIFHLAAAFERSKESPEFWNTNWHDNVLLSRRIVDLIREMPNLDTFVFASSYLVYSPSLYLSSSLRDDVVYLKENDLIAPRNLCGAAKYYAERELDFAKAILSPSLRAVFARIYRVYGCGSRDVISRWVRAALSGDEIEVHNKENRFDYIFAGDVAEGLLALAGSQAAEGPLNLGSGTARKIQDVLDILVKYIPSARARIRDIGSNGPFEASCADLARLKRLTRWVPSTDLENGMKTIIEFEQNQGRTGGGT